ncbi:MAG TPA: tetratricopeptide repeat protein [Bacteroidetes bacterium]|nr:tetratricopeptide repeat protein [Bacteroidota bacterium]
MITDEKIDWQEVNTLISEKRADELYPILKERVEKDPDDHDAGCALARILLERGEYETAHEWLWRIVEKDPYYARAAMLLNRMRLIVGSDFGHPRPRLLLNVESGRVSRAFLPWADIIFFAPSQSQSRPPELLVYDIYRDTFKDVLDGLPSGWQPDWVLFFLNEAYPLPLGIHTSPYPTVCLPGDCFPLHKLTIDLDFFDAVFPGLKRYEAIFSRMAPGRTLYRAGAAIQGASPRLQSSIGDEQHERRYDVVFIGDFGNPYYARRTRYVERLLRLKKKYNILVSEKKYTFQQYIDFLFDAKIVIETPNVQGGINMRSYEACQAGALLMHEELDGSIAEFFEPGEEVVLFDEDNFEQQIEYYLSNENEAERVRIAENGRRKALTECTAERLGKDVLEELELKNISRMQMRPAEHMSLMQRFNQIGVSDFYSGVFDRAVDLFQMALQHEPASFKSINNLAVACHALAANTNDANLRERTREMLQFVATQSSFLLGKFNLLQVISHDGSPSALDLARELIETLENFSPSAPQVSESPFDGLVLHQELVPKRHLSHFPPAAIAIEQLLERYPQKGTEYEQAFADILLWKTRQIYAQMLCTEGKFFEAESNLQSAIKKAPENHSLLYDLGKVLLRQKKWAEAEDAFRKSLDILPLCFETEKGLLEALVGAGKMDQARQIVDSICDYDVYSQEQIDELLALVNKTQPPVDSVNGQNVISPFADHLLHDFIKSTQNQDLFSHPDWPVYVEECKKFFAAFPASLENREFDQINLLPQLDDRDTTTEIDRYYFYQDAWAARKIFKLKPKSLVDVASRTSFVGLISGFVPTTFVDIRPIDVNLDGLTVKKGDILDMPFESGSVEMVSSLSVVEHIGLGRYGDDIMPDGSRRACAELLRIVRPGGYLLIAVPAGPPMIAFNAHRIFSCEQILSYFPGTKLLDEAFLYPTPGPREGMRYLKPGKYVFYCFLLQKEGGAVDENGKEKSPDHGDHRARWLVSG